jgi:O-antigen ligase
MATTAMVIAGAEVGAARPGVDVGRRRLPELPWRWARDSLREADAVTLVTLWLILLFGLPERMVLPPLGAAGAPQAILGLVMLGLWIASHVVPTLMPARGVQPIRQAFVVFLWTNLFLYVLAVMRGLPGVQQRAADRYLLMLLGMAGVALVIADGVRTRERLDTLLQRLCLAGMGLALIGLIEQFTGFAWATFVRVPGLSLNRALFLGVQRGALDRISGTANHPIGYAVPLGLLLPLAIHYAMTAEPGRERQWRVTVALVIAAGLPLALSRSAIVALAVGLLGLFLGWAWRQRVNALGIFVVALVGIQVALPGRLSTLINLFVNADQDNSVTARTRDYEQVFHYISEFRWFGLGPGVFLPEEFLQLDNQALKFLLEGGLVGALAAILLFVTSIRLTRAVRRIAPDWQTRQLARCLSAMALAAAATTFTFDALSYTFYGGVLFVVFGAAGALWRLSIAELMWHDSTS